MKKLLAIISLLIMFLGCEQKEEKQHLNDKNQTEIINSHIKQLNNEGKIKYFIILSETKEDPFDDYWKLTEKLKNDKILTEEETEYYVKKHSKVTDRDKLIKYAEKIEKLIYEYKKKAEE
ncbi:MAG: hypothetical protein U9Q33_01655 [Campylobacterota bacterium]|nr:hypothetical protein [Campylobacterota bacterium]